MGRLNPSGAPPETKFVAQSFTHIAVSLISGYLITTVFKNDIPASDAPFVPAVVAWILGSGAGWCAKHTPRLDEVVKALGQQLAHQLNTATPTVRQAFTAQTPPPPSRVPTTRVLIEEEAPDGPG